MLSSDSGWVRLKSGYWKWVSSPAGNGYAVVFRHATLPRDEMKTWIERNEKGGMEEAARDPVYRTWEDPNGALWLVSIDFASLQKDSHVWIMFRNALRELAAYAEAETRLGELTTAELVRYLDQAE